MAKVKTAAWTLAAAEPASRSSRRWVPVTGLVMAFVLGFASGVVGSAPESGGSVFGVVAFVVWLALVSVALFASAARAGRSAD